MEVRTPTMEEAKSMPAAMCSLSNESLYVLAEMGHHDACKERLVRNVMAVDGVDWLTASEVVKHIGKRDTELLWLMTMPYKVGIAGGLTAAVGCVPMVFNRTTAEVVNAKFVTSDVPEPQDLETCWEVGAWAWNWMEPPLGVASFVILAMQLVRSQMQNMDFKPYTSWVKNYRARRLTALYPQYNEDMVLEFSLSGSMNGKR